ncbi:hypothetical protein NLJ89_g3668 [Agrocybe chaxingu]|uniref:Peptidase S53 domain-containing protein n=1 Tax=Agrocybe chaxingu TaxID=84603 RepID=A0A9W8MWN6_9AGAR|nr:hypothetical protein NLJ89_g3668 [Agrocybe chaxingu]
MRFTPVFLHLLTLISLGVAAHASYIPHETRSHIPAGWTLARRYEASELLPLRFGLKQSNMDRLEEMLNDVSHPESPNFGNHWTPTQVAKTFAPSHETVTTVRNWLIKEGFDAKRLKVSATRAWVQLNATVEEAERLLKTQYNVYTHQDGEQHIACNSYYLPKHVSPHVEVVTPSIHFDAVLRKRGGSSVPAKKIGLPGVGITPKTTGTIKNLWDELKNCDQFITPICLRALYGLVYEPLAASKNSFGIVEYTPQAYLQSDLDMFNRNFSTALVGKSPKLVSIDGGIVQTIQTGFEYNGESNLDLQYAMNLVNMVGYKQEVTLYQVGDIPQGASFNNLLDALDGSYCTFQGGDDPFQDGIYPDDYPNGYHNPTDCGIAKPANVISTSYGYNEADLSPLYTARQCAEYAKLGLMGVTVIYSSGDNGVAGNGDLCLNADGIALLPAFAPADAVIYSGGGFSNYFAMPDYQKKAVGNYLKNHKPTYSPEIWNATGTSRAFPDISANGANYVVAVDGKFSRIFGTSASAPVVGSILTMVNDARLAIGKKPIGFINPTIYSDFFGGAFNDITSGGNQGCGTSGFTAVPGWDPVTGLGTPSFPKLLAS